MTNEIVVSWGKTSFRCANERCHHVIDYADHVTVVTTYHVRRFCGMQCVVKGFEVQEERALREALNWIREEH